MEAVVQRRPTEQNFAQHMLSAYSTNHVYLHRFFAFAILRLRLKRKTHPTFRVLNVFYYQTDFNLRFKRKRDVRLTCRRV